MTFGEVVRDARLARGWSQDELAARIDCKRAFVSRIETGGRGVDVGTLQKLASVLEIDGAQLLELAAARSNDGVDEVA